MLTQWIYSSPTWEWGGLFILAIVAVSLLGLHLFDKLVHLDARRDNTENLAIVLGVVGTMYALLLGFIAVAVWQSFDNSEKTVIREANLISILHRNTAGLPDADTARIKGYLRDYTRIVTEQEWPTQMKGDEVSYEPSHLVLQDLHKAIIAIDASAGASSALAQGALLQTLNDLYMTRRDRYMAANGDSGVPDVIWMAVLLGTLLTIGTSFLLGPASLTMHRVMTAILATAIGLILVLVIALDRPFRGELSISKEPYEFNVKVFK